MSPANFSLNLTLLAQTDFQDILVYTEQRWGARQADLYAEILDAALRSLTVKPDKGYSLAGTDYLFIRAGKHRIFYRIYGPDVKVVRILHGKMDFESHLE